MIKDLFSFLKNPSRFEEYTPMTAKDFFVLLFAVLVVITPYGLIMEQLDLQFDNMVEELMRDYKWIVVAGAIILAPILEEPAFRMHLDYKRNSFFWGIGLAILFLSELWYIPVAYMGYLFYCWMKVKENDPPKLKFVVYTSAAFFGLVHLGNYQNVDWSQYFYFMPILVLAQFLLGLVLSFIRMKHGLKYAIFFHGAYNAILLIPTAIWGDF
ncbi:CPBP family intramembrane glutamic endopeptidase [Algoriphagus sediminis]|uniref:CPBP family intramembrane metalloprotease n=1 Tax=Algoriphagus sediminis TaxID=3057113 RepID=A0ABT7YDE2_9BACT|nr:CPBP family intramembrane glutamic endopeptidase [Algoriphagus sediminis]MDN3204224.1 CPBP family intramembrane metalloprotease [Algoriphagus sediminis]